MKIIYFVLQIFFFSGAVYAGNLCAKKKPVLSNFLAVFGLIMIFFENIISHFPEYEIMIFPFADYVFFRRWGYAGAFFVFGVSFTQVKMSTKKLLYVLITLMCVLRVYFLYIALYPVYDFQERGFDEYGICIQSTGYTCGAAACATLLNILNISTTETEMAVLCGTNKYTGTQYLEMVRGLKLKTNNSSSVKIMRRDWETLSEADMPCITSVKLNNLTAHVIVLLKKNDTDIIVGDPLQGMRTISRERFLEKWRNRIITVKSL